MPLLPELFADLAGFQWDEGNSEKNWRGHGVTKGECEQVFLNRPVLVVGDLRHSTEEARYFAFGRTDGSRLLAIVFTLRASVIRVISARPMNRRERRLYAES